jgi:hypothetical protein
VNPERLQGLPQIHGFLPIHFQGMNSCPPLRTDADDGRLILIPNKMIRPMVISGMKQLYHHLIERIKSGAFVVLAIVTMLASKARDLRDHLFPLQRMEGYDL